MCIHIYRLSEVYPEYKNISLSFPLFSNQQQPQELSSSNAVSEESSLLVTGPQKMAQVFNVKYLGKLPMDPSVLSCGEVGSGLLEAYPNSVAAKYLSHIVDSLILLCDERLTQQTSSMITDS